MSTSDLRNIYLHSPVSDNPKTLRADVSSPYLSLYQPVRWRGFSRGLPKAIVTVELGSLSHHLENNYPRWPPSSHQTVFVQEVSLYCAKLLRLRIVYTAGSITCLD